MSDIELGNVEALEAGEVELSPEEMDEISGGFKKPAEKKGYVCKICGYVYEGEELPEDFICPLCKHGVADFEPIG